jgi:putative transposase
LRSVVLSLLYAADDILVQPFMPDGTVVAFDLGILLRFSGLNVLDADSAHLCPGKPSDNAYIEAFNNRIQQESLNAAWFLSMADARQRINDWRVDYNHHRPHTALGNLTPNAFAEQLYPTRKFA